MSRFMSIVTDERGNFYMIRGLKLNIIFQLYSVYILSNFLLGNFKMDKISKYILNFVKNIIFSYLTRFQN